MGLNRRNVDESRNPLENPCEVSVQLPQQHHRAQVFQFVGMRSSVNLAQGVGRPCHAESLGTLDLYTMSCVFEIIGVQRPISSNHHSCVLMVHCVN